MEVDAMVVVPVVGAKGFKKGCRKCVSGDAGAGTHDRHEHSEGCLVHQEALNMEAWQSRRPQIL